MHDETKTKISCIYKHDNSFGFYHFHLLKDFSLKEV